MKMIAHTMLIACVLAGFPADFCAAEGNSSWKSLGQAKIQKKKRSGTVAFRPELSLDENNPRLSRHRDSSVTVTIAVPSDSLGGLDLVNRPVSFEYQDSFFPGRITGVMLSDTGQATLFANIDLAAQPSVRSAMRDEETGVLSIGE
jgi:hypothetical protein